MKSIPKYTEKILKKHNLTTDDVTIRGDVFSGVKSIEIKNSRGIIKRILQGFNNNIFDVIEINMKSNNIIESAVYELWCNNQERFINKKHIYIQRDTIGKGYGTIVLDSIIETGKILGCHSIYAECDSEKHLHNGGYTWAVMGYDFDHHNEAGVKIMQHKHHFVVSESKVELQKKFSIYSLHELLHTPEGKDYRKYNHFGFQGKFDLTPDSQSLQKFEEYKRTKK